MLKALNGVALAAGLLFAGAVHAADHEIQMLNRGSDGQMMVFEPAFLKIEPGDTVTFIATDPSHNAESVLGMMPEGAEAFKGRINEEISVTFDLPGVYGIKCMPHYPMGMIGLIQVGDDVSNVQQAMTVQHPGQAATRMALLFEEIQQDAASGSAEPEAEQAAAAQ